MTEIIFLLYCRIRRVLTFGIRFTNRDPEYKKYNIGEFTYGTPQILNYGNLSKLQIGKFCSIAKNVTIIIGGNHSTKGITTYPFTEVLSLKKGPITTSKGDVIIENDVWIGYGATILSGVTIGNGSIIGARAIVSKSIPPYSVVVGNPGKIIKKRFTEKKIKELEKMQWWNWDIKKIEQNIELIT